MQVFYGSLKVDLPDDPIEAANMLAAVTGRWAEMLKQLDMKHVEAEVSINETRTKKPRPARTQKQTTNGDSPRLAV